MKINYSVIILIALSLLVISCAHAPHEEGAHGGDSNHAEDFEHGSDHGDDEHEQEHEKVEFENKDEILNEVSRLANLAATERITAEDVDSLKELIGDNEHAIEELKGIEALVKNNEFEHATHGLSFFDSFVRSGEHPICPAHELAHYYIYQKIGEQDLAQNALRIAKSQIDVWSPLAKEQLEKYPARYTFDQILDSINGHIASIESGKKNATDEEIEYLVSDASICVEHSSH